MCQSGLLLSSIDVSRYRCVCRAQVLRLNGFSPACLRRRSTPDEPRSPEPSQVALWTNHRVMEWLREVDLAEYAPNMRGSGQPGAADQGATTRNWCILWS